MTKIKILMLLFWMPEFRRPGVPTPVISTESEFRRPRIPIPATSTESELLPSVVTIGSVIP